MKKLLLIFTLLLASAGVSVSAQGARSGIFGEFGLGVACGDINTDLGLSLGVGYRYHITGGLSWDMLKVAYYVPTATNDFGDGSSLRILTGVRYDSAPLLAGLPLYANFGAGYQMNVSDFDYWHGFAYEFGLGVKPTGNVSVGLVWEGDVAYYNLGMGSINSNFGIFGIKLAYQF